MATIQIHNLNPAGSDLFADSESFMNALSDAEMTMQGGITPILIVTAIGYGVTVSLMISINLE